MAETDLRKNGFRSNLKPAPKEANNNYRLSHFSTVYFESRPLTSRPHLRKVFIDIDIDIEIQDSLIRGDYQTAFIFQY